ncbi:conjugal transfer protein TraF [Halorhodospira sp. 9622]|uniref:conjugal transfer protein TraF n=1 Tax=Halorhodospira sp. 9622 TaxID=2899136 RepID=UPI001EE8C9C8|nr:conjugal transfer protein TraF [Halorhodospira sp. 9622]MCG5538397.1 conjugal transfer protein TraF [Halorhodospira sp. 9622]
MRRALLGAGTGMAATLACTPLLAAPYHPSGANLAYGEISHTQGVMGSVANPASGAAMPRGFRFGLGSLGVGYELGEIDGFVDDFEDWADDFDRLDDVIRDFERAEEQFDVSDLDGQADDALRPLLDAVGEIQAIERRGQSLLDRGQDDGFLAVTGGVHAPPGPLVANHAILGGALTLDVQGTGSARLGIAGGRLESGLGGMPLSGWDCSKNANDATCGSGDWEIKYDGDDVTIKGPDREVGEVSEDDLALYSDMEAAAIGRFSLGYSARTYSSRDGELFVGGRGHYYQAEMARAVSEIDDDALDTLSDDFSDSRSSDDAFGVDLGLLWVARNYQVGLTGKNLNEPSLDYPEIVGYDDLPASVQDRVSRTKSYTLERQGTVEASLHSPNRRWMLGFSHDLNSVEGPHGAENNNEYQWTAVGVGYASESYLWPGFRLGYRTNNAGSELSYITGGLTLFRVLNIDAAVSTDDVEHDGSSVPRSALVNVGLELGF